jgi:putative N-acetyltransferase (TIGR04045 family)
MPLLDQSPAPPPPFYPGEYRIEQAITAAQKAACHALRRQIFCNEQRVFESDDRDEIDERCLLLAASSCLFGHADDVVGTVRIHQPEAGLWWGSRLAVVKPARRVGGLGAALIKFAVGTAKFHGASTFLAHVQAQNLKLFQALHWHVLDDKMIHGLPHYLMQADIDFYESTGGAPMRVLPSIACA